MRRSWPSRSHGTVARWYWLARCSARWIRCARSQTLSSKLVAAGSRYDGIDYNVTLARFASDGTLDPTFGGTGVIATDFSTESDDMGHGVVVQPDDKIVVAGSLGRQSLVARYLGSGCTTLCEPPQCPAPPACGPEHAERNSLLMRNEPRKTKLFWTWSKSVSAVDVSEFGLPGFDSDFDLQLIDSRFGGDRVIAHWPFFSFPGGSWVPIHSGFRFKLDSPTLGLLVAKLRSGPARKGRLAFRWKLPEAPGFFPLPLTPPVAIRFTRTDGRACWGSTFTPSTIRKNDGAIFQAD